MRSMTGFGRASGESTRWVFTVSVRSVNHRFLDVSYRSREGFRPLESRVRRLLEKEVHRGRVEVNVDCEARGGDQAELTLSSSTAERVTELLSAFEKASSAAVTVTLGDLLRVPGLVVQGSAPDGQVEEEDEEALLQTVASALKPLLAMRTTEGTAIRGALLRALEQLETARAAIEARREEWIEELSDRLAERLQRLLSDRGVAVEPSRYVQEAAVLTERSDITEELERWAGHLEAVRESLGSPGPHGKKLDFLAQEILREVNTVGSKARDLAIAERVVEAKLASEALREQIQNVE